MYETAVQSSTGNGCNVRALQDQCSLESCEKIAPGTITARLPRTHSAYQVGTTAREDQLLGPGEGPARRAADVRASVMAQGLNSEDSALILPKVVSNAKQIPEVYESVTLDMLSGEAPAAVMPAAQTARTTNTVSPVGGGAESVPVPGVAAAPGIENPGDADDGDMADDDDSDADSDVFDNFDIEGAGVAQLLHDDLAGEVRKALVIIAPRLFDIKELTVVAVEFETAPANKYPIWDKIKPTRNCKVLWTKAK